MSLSQTDNLGDGKTMKKLTFAVVGAVALMTGACSGGNEDQVNNAEMNQTGAELNDLANDAANNAAEAENLAAQQQQLEANNAAEVTDNTVNPKDADEQNVSGM
jgi:hypothetical protein